MKPKPVTAWSYSKLSCYETCPRQFRHRYVDKLEGDKSPAMERGLLVHGQLEAFVKAKKAPSLPSEFKQLLPALKAFKTAGAVAEREAALDKDWRSVPWFDSRAWLRAKIDLTAPLAINRSLVIDYKTGRPNPERHVEQMMLYALIVLMLDAAAQYVEHGLWYVDHHPTPHLTGVLERDAGMITRARNMWGDRARRMLADRKWKPRPSPSACRWCPFSIKKGGPCEAGV